MKQLKFFLFSLFFSLLLQAEFNLNLHKKNPTISYIGFDRPTDTINSFPLYNSLDSDLPDRLSFDNEFINPIIDASIKRTEGSYPIPPIVGSNIFQVALRPTNFDTTVTSGNAMFTINRSGRYFFSNPIILGPANDDVIGIKISTSNVVLDFSSHMLTQSSDSIGNTLTAISVDANVSNIAIIYGSIRNVNGTGIKINTASNILITNMVIDNCYLLGVDINACKNVVIQSLAITNCPGSHGNAIDGAVGIKIAGTHNIRMFDSFYNKNTTSSTIKNGAGLLLNNCKACRIQGCAASGNQGANAYGFRLTNTCQSIVFRDCDFAGNVSNKGIACGISCEYSKAVTLVGAYSGSHQSAGGDCYGFYACNSEGLDFFSCFTKDNKATSSGADCAGFSFLQVDNSRFVSCHALTNVSTSSSVYGFSLVGCQSTLFKECAARGNDASSSTKHGYGFYASAGAGNMFKECNSFNNKGGAQTTSIAAGFALRNGESYSAIQGCNIGGNNTNGEAYGIMVGYTSESPSIRCVIDKNNLINNIGSKKYGYRDFADNTTTLLATNVSFGHGKISPSTTAQLTLANTMNFMFTYTTAQYPGYVVGENKIGAVATITSSNPYANLSLYEYP